MKNPTNTINRQKRLFRTIGTIISATTLLTSQSLWLLNKPVFADQTNVCPVAGKDGVGNLNGIINTYYPGGNNATVAVGATSIPVGAINTAGSATPIQAGDLLLIIQMQDADINSNDTDAYGDGTTGDVPSNVGTSPSSTAASGITALNNAGRYEYAIASAAVSGGVITIQSGTKYSYRNQATSTPKRTYQVVRVPQYTTATVNGTLTTSAQWNGSSGGIVVVDVAQQLTFAAGSRIDVNGLGFRGGGSNPNGVTSGGRTQFPSLFRSTSAGSGAGVDAPKGEGIAGTPRLVATQPFGSFNVRSASATADLGASRYPNGDEGRGAPGNAGGGGNEHNAGGGGGANGGNGGMGGRSFNNFGGTTPDFDAYVGGFGGKALLPDPLRLFLGGGGGAGDTNNQATPSGAGGGGGGIVIVRAGNITGSGIIDAKGADGIDSPAGSAPDAGGGGGAGGTVLITTAIGNAGGVTINAQGGKGGNLNVNNTAELDGTGGGGGGGIAYTNGGAVLNATRGNPGVIVNSTTVRNNTSNGATAGTDGSSQPVTASTLTTSISGATGCDQLTVTKTTNTPRTNAGSTATYTITISNATGKPTVTDVNISDTLPSGFTYDATLGTPTFTSGASRTTTTNPTAGTPTPSWGAFTIPAGGSVSITFIANLNSNVPTGTYNNPATVTYKDSGGVTRTASYNQTASTGEDVAVNATPSPPPASAAPKGGICGVAGKDGPVATLSGIVNTYYPGTASVTAGAKSINLDQGLGASTPTPISPGDLLLVIQMQDASINSTDTASYGSGNTANDGSGQTNMGNSGVYEYVVATNSVPIAGGTLNFRGASSGSGLINNYTNANVNGSAGQRRFQVVRVPQYSNVTLSSTLTALEWNGKVGGIVALDVVGDLNFNGRTLDAVNRGFRAGYSQKDSSGNSTTAYTGATSTSIGAGKGEGTAGTPQFVWNGTTAVNNGSSGYPGGDYGRGAPANAGGGGNFHNAGGGGGGNGGIGGKGALPWRGAGGPLDSGGRPGSLSSTAAAAVSRLIMGGGGGGGDANNATTGVRGGVGGGIALLRAGRIAGTGTIVANGDDGDVGTFGAAPDGAGGGGAGGTILISSRNNSPGANINIQANGGKGGNTENDANDEHGPGGGGGGGVVVYNLPGGTITSSLNGGVSGKTNKGNGISHGAASGTVGQVSQFTATDDPYAAVNDTSCLPLLTVVKTTTTPTTTAGGKATYKIAVSNGTGRSDAIDVNISDVLPTGFTYEATVGTPTLSGGATRTSTTNPTAGATSPVWDKFTIPANGKVEITFTVNVGSNVAAGKYDNPAKAEYLDPARTTATGTTSATYNSTSSTGEDVTIANNPKLLLVKRITAINNVNLNQFVDDTTSAKKDDDNDPKWPAPKDINSGISTYLRGVIDGSKVKPGDDLEYTVYFLSSGNTPIKNVSICDLVPANTTFFKDPSKSGSDIALTIGSTNTNLTNAVDSDRGQFIQPNTQASGSCNKAAFSNPTPPPPLPAAQNLTGAVVVDVVTGATTLPDTPSGFAYGFIRFHVKVK